MDLTLLENLDSLIRYYWKPKIREHIRSLGIEISDSENTIDFLKRLDTDKQYSDIFSIAKSLLKNPTLQVDVNMLNQIAGRLVEDWVSDLKTLFKNEGYNLDTESDSVTSNEPSTIPQKEIPIQEPELDPDSGNDENPTDKPKKYYKKIIATTLLGLLFIGGPYVAFTVDIDIIEGDVNIGDTTNIYNDDKLTDISQDTLLDTYRETQPYSLEWTSCGSLIHEMNRDGNTASWNMPFTPILLDKNSDPSLIQFNILLKFKIEGLVEGNTFPIELNEEHSGIHTVIPSNRSPFVLDLTEEFEQAKKDGAFLVRVSLLQVKIAPYYEPLDKNLLDYKSFEEELVMTELGYTREPVEWSKMEVKDSVCNNLFLR